tara:strand:- start:309 stop:563 length:255 start_codon:yes stop_codon:yes gene_type:complete
MRSLDILFRKDRHIVGRILSLNPKTLDKIYDYISSGEDPIEYSSNNDRVNELKQLEHDLFKMAVEDPSNPLIDELQYKYVHYGM